MPERPIVAALAVVTGGAGGIGAACARALSRPDRAVLVVDRDQQRAETVAAGLRANGREASALQADVSDVDFSAAVAAAAKRIAPVQTAVHAVAYEEHRPALDTPVESLLTSYLAGPVAAFSLFRTLVADDACAPGPAFTAIGSLHETKPFRGCLGYNAAHAALGQVVRTLAHEWAARRVRVNAVVPGWITTPGEEVFYGAEHLRKAAAQLPFGEMGTPEQVADAVAYLASEGASYISGSFLTVDGALSVSLARLPEEEP